MCHALDTGVKRLLAKQLMTQITFTLNNECPPPPPHPRSTVVHRCRLELKEISVTVGDLTCCLSKRLYYVHQMHSSDMCLMFNDPLKIDLTVSASVVIPPVKTQALFHHALSITLEYYVRTYIRMHTVALVTLLMCCMSQSDS